MHISCICVLSAIISTQNMQQINEVIRQYLEMNTNFSIMISGNWGIGKTFYYKNHITDLIKNTSVFNDNSKKYKPIVISLFGIKTIEELQSQIFLSLYPFISGKKIKIASSIAKVIAKGILTIKGLGEYSKILDNVNVKGENLLNFNELVICFDDLERISENLKLEEVIGFINNLVENENAKIILIANEDKIKDENYKILKEKVVGNTVEFQPNKKNTLNSIIDTKFSGYKAYQDFLKGNETFIIDNFFNNSQNLRTLTYALSYFHKIFSNFEIEVLKNKVLESKKDEIIQKLLKFTLVISIENKNGFLDYKIRNNLDNNVMTGLEHINLENLIGSKKTNEEIEEAKDYKDKFLEKYYPEEKFTFFNSIYNYITGGNAFNISELIEELNSLYYVEENEVPEQYKIYSLLSYPNVFELKDENYNEMTTKLEEYAIDGHFKINEYLTIFYFLTRFNNPLKFDFNDLVNRLKQGIDKSAEVSEKVFLHDLDFYLNVSEKSENKEYLMDLKSYIIDVNNKINDNNNFEDLNNLEKLYYNNKEDFFKTILNSENKYFYSEVFTHFDANIFHEDFMSIDTKEKWNLIKYLKVRYKNTFSSQFKGELAFFEKLLICFSEKFVSDCGPSSYVSREFEKLISEICEKLK